MIKLGPAGASGMSTLEAIKYFKKIGIPAMEVEFVRGIKMSNQLAKKIGNLAKKLNIELSVHAPYYINLNSKEKKKIQASKKRILQSAERAHHLGAKKIVFHPGYYGKSTKEQTYQNIKKAIMEMQEIIKKNKWKVRLAPETTGKINVFGSIREIKKLIKDTRCSYCIDFAHLYARNLKINIDFYKFFKAIVKQFKGHIHAHFSGIEFGPKGEKFHKITDTNQLRALLRAVKDKDITIINESPDPIKDTMKGIKILKTI